MPNIEICQTRTCKPLFLPVKNQKPRGFQEFRQDIIFSPTQYETVVNVV